MQLAKVIGTATATVKHPSLAGQKMLVCQPLDVQGQPESDPLLAIDICGAGFGSQVMICSDTKRVRALVGDNTTPIRWFIVGILDQQEKG